MSSRTFAINRWYIRTKFEIAEVVDQDVRCLDVAMQHALVVAVLEPLDQLLHEPLDLVSIKVHTRVTDQPGEVVVEILEHHVDRVASLSVGLGRRHDVLQPHNVLMPQQRQQLDLPHRRLRKALLSRRNHHLLDRDLLPHAPPLLSLLAQVDLSIRPLADLTQPPVDVNVCILPPTAAHPQPSGGHHDEQRATTQSALDPVSPGPQRPPLALRHSPFFPPRVFCSLPEDGIRHRRGRI